MEAKNEKKVGRMSIDDMIALYHIVDEFDEFNAKLNDNLKSTTDDETRYFINKLSMVSWGETVIGWKNAKNFYKQYKNIIDTINKYSRIDLFLHHNYSDACNSCIDEFYKYLIEHKDRLEEILSLLTKLKKLGIEKVTFDESLDFTNTSYHMYSNFDDNFDIIYLDNMYAVPNYPSNTVEYRTKDSNYKMSLRVDFKEFPTYCRNIEVNSLLFGIDRLPEEITKDAIYKTILRLREGQIKECINIGKTINLSVSIDDLYAQFLKTSRVVESIDEYEYDYLLKFYLEEIKKFLDLLKKASIEYNESIFGADSPITQDLLEQEKAKYLKRRFLSSIDFD